MATYHAPAITYPAPIYFAAELDGSTATTDRSLPDHDADQRSISQFTATPNPSLNKVVFVPQKVSDALSADGFEVGGEGIVRWAPYSLTSVHPRRWPLARKLNDTALICFLEFFVTLTSNTGSSIASIAADELGVSREMALFCFTTLYLLGQALGGLIFSPMAESFGGRTIYVSSTFAYAILCIAIALRPSLPIVIGGRLLTGFLSAIPAVVAVGRFENMWDVASRSLAIHIWQAAAVVGLCAGSPIAIVISTSSMRWPWVFVVAAIVTGVAAVFCLAMQESRPSQVLRQKVKLISKEAEFDGLSLEGEACLPTLSKFVRTSLWLPVRLFFTEPIVFTTSIMAATVMAVLYLFSEARLKVYVGGFGFTDHQASLTMLAIAIGVLLAALPRFYDHRVMTLRKHQNKVLEPEDKMFGFLLAAPVLAAGLWWFASTIPPLAAGISPWVSIAALVLVGFSTQEFTNLLAGYLCDTYASNASSANAPMAFLRAMMSGTFPLFGRQYYEKLGANDASYILASVATVFCVVAVLFSIYGKRLRESSPFAEMVWTESVSTEKVLLSVVVLAEEKA